MLARIMCGIAGVWYFDGKRVEEASLRRMADAQKHRGPDGEGFFVDGPLGLAHRRLEIVDPGPLSDQPMADESGRFRIVYNGEVHNYLELRRDLESAGHVFRSGGDTEVVLQAFVAWGEECFRRFNGMWALAVWDARDRALTLSRDRFGIKPLCVSRRGARLAFASEPKAILAAFPEEREPDRRELAAFLQGAVPDGTEATFFRNIRTIPPDSVVRIEGGKQTRRKFWGFTPGEDRPRPDSVEAFSELFGDATALRLRSDVPVGACLSGGMDSSAIVARAAPRLPGGMDCFSLLYPGAPCDESRFAAAVAEAMPTCRLHWVEPDASDLLATMERIVWHHDAPAPLRGRYPQWYVFGAASRHVRVVLDGQGGDEMLGGYQRFAPAYLLDRLRGLPPGGPNTASLPVEVVRLAGLGNRGLAGLAAGCAAPALRRMGRGLHLPADVLHADLRAAGGDFDPRRYFSVWLNPLAERPFRSHLNNALWNEFVYAGLPEVLHGEDALSMAWSIESRHPLLDHRLVEFCFSLPYGAKIANGRTKDVMRRALASELPAKIVERRDKKGFPAPMTQWLRRPDCVRQWRALLLSAAALERGVFDAQRLRGALDRFERDARFAARCTEALWRWINVELWFRLFS